MKLNFVYSQIYDEMLNKAIKKDLPEQTIREMLYFKEEIDAFWSKYDKKIISELEKVSGLKFKKNMDCYVVSKMFYAAISNPLTIRKDGSLESFKHKLIHELVHVLLNDNKNKTEKLILKSYSDEDFDFKNHVPVLLITRKVIENLFGKNEFEDLLKEDMKIELRYIWPEVNKIYPKFHNNIVKFLKNEKLR